MKIAVIGAGIVGLTTAYELATDGQQVTLMEKASTAAVASSFATSGVISPALYGAELGTPTDKHDKKSVQRLFQALQQPFPGAAEYSNGLQIWKGSFGVMSDGLPVIGHTVFCAFDTTNSSRLRP